MGVMFPSSRPNVSVRVITKKQATLKGAGGIAINKIGGVWTVQPQWTDLQLITPGVFLDPGTKEIWTRDPASNVYNRMTLANMGQALWWGTSLTPNVISAGSRTFQTQSNKDWQVGMYVQAVAND